MRVCDCCKVQIKQGFVMDDGKLFCSLSYIDYLCKNRAPKRKKQE